MDATVTNSQTRGVALWPLAGREQLLNAYRPGAQPAEGPLRTLRSHHFLSHGVRIPLVEDSRLSGQTSLFCSLNLDAVRWARRGETAAAAAAAAAAAEIEQSAAFSRLCKLVSSLSPADIRLVGAGNVATSALDGELGSLLRQVAAHTEQSREALRRRWHAPWEHTTTGWILDRRDDFVMMETTEGYRAQVPLSWALRVHRADAGQALVLIVEDFDNVLIHNILPGLWMGSPGRSGKPELTTTRPAALSGGFGGPRGVRVTISNENADRLERSEPLRVLVPVAIAE